MVPMVDHGVCVRKAALIEFVAADAGEPTDVGAFVLLVLLLLLLLGAVVVVVLGLGPR